MKSMLSAITVSALCACAQAKPEKPNIILFFADDISAREIPIYNSSVWSKPGYGTTTNPEFRANTPNLDKLATEGCWIKTTWAATICSPSRGQLLTGRYGYQTKWWHNGALGYWRNKDGQKEVYPLYESSPVQLGQVAKDAGYRTYWAGKTQMKSADLTKFGFEEGCFTPGGDGLEENPYTDFQIIDQVVDGKKICVNKDTGKPFGGYRTYSYYWMPSVQLMNDPSNKETLELWPNTPKAKKSYGPHSYAPDIELDFTFNFMDRAQESGKPFFVFHASHLGHGHNDWLHPDEDIKWPGTPKIHWDGEKYTRTEPVITGDKGVYDTHGTITERGQHHQINYIDYQIWQYRQKLEEMGVADNTIIIFAADNGTHGYGKGSTDRQRGCHVPMLIYAPGMTKHGEQDILVNLADVMPTIAELVGTEIPDGYEINGKSLVPYLFTDKADHRDWIYSYKEGQQLVRGKNVMRDGAGKWWDVSTTPDDLISFREITDWEKEPKSFREEREMLLETIKPFDKFEAEPNAPGFVDDPGAKKAPKKKDKKQKKAGKSKK